MKVSGRSGVSRASTLRSRDAKGQEPTPSSLYFVHTARQLRLDRTGGSSVCLSRAEEKKPEERPQARSAG